MTANVIAASSIDFKFFFSPYKIQENVIPLYLQANVLMFPVHLLLLITTFEIILILDVTGFLNCQYLHVFLLQGSAGEQAGESA